MKPYFALAALWLMTSTAWALDAKLDFDGDTYHLAFAKQAETESINEYLLKGDTLEQWKRMVALHIYPNQENVTPAQFAFALGKMIKQTNPKAQYEIIASATRDVVMIDFVTWDPAQPTMIEFNLMKFKKSASGKEMLSHQFAVRSYGKDASGFEEEVKNGRARWRTLLAGTKYPNFISEE